MAAGHGVALVGVMRSAFGCLVVLATRWCRAAWVDVDTPPGARRSKAYTMPGRILDLVFSDECVPPASRRAARGAVGRSVAVAVGSVRFGALFERPARRFEADGRSFKDGFDPRWTAVHKNDYTNKALQYYHEDYVGTGGGFLNITTTSEHTKFTSYQVHRDRKVRKTVKKTFLAKRPTTYAQ